MLSTNANFGFFSVCHFKYADSTEIFNCLTDTCVLHECASMLCHLRSSEIISQNCGLDLLEQQRSAREVSFEKRFKFVQAMVFIPPKSVFCQSDHEAEFLRCSALLASQI